MYQCNLLTKLHIQIQCMVKVDKNMESVVHNYFKSNDLKVTGNS